MPDAPSTDPTRPASRPDDRRTRQPAADTGAFRGSAGPPVDPDDSGPPRRGRVAVVLPWVLVVLALAATAFSTWQWQQLTAREGRADSARVAALAFVEDLTNWDAADGLDDEIETLRQQAPGPSSTRSTWSSAATS